MKIKDWNHFHKIKEKIEEQYNVFVHLLGKGCFITTNDPKLIEENNWDNTLVFFHFSPDEVESITSLGWAEKVVNEFIKKFPLNNHGKRIHHTESKE